MCVLYVKETRKEKDKQNRHSGGGEEHVKSIRLTVRARCYFSVQSRLCPSWYRQRVKVQRSLAACHLTCLSLPPLGSWFRARYVVT